MANESKSHTREFKLQVVKWHCDHGMNNAHTSFHFSVDRKSARRWVKSEVCIRKSKQLTRKNNSGRKAAFPNAEKNLRAQFIVASKERKKLKHWWFTSRMGQLVSELYDEKANMFKHSDRWVEAFCRRYKVALRTKTHWAQKAPESVGDDVTRFHKKLLRIRKRGKFQPSDIANMDQTPLSFIYDDGSKGQRVQKMCRVQQGHQAYMSANVPHS